VESPLRQGRRRTAAYIVHAGATLALVAIAVSSTMGTSKELQLREGEKATVGAYTLTFLKAEQGREPPHPPPPAGGGGGGGAAPRVAGGADRGEPGRPGPGGPHAAHEPVREPA